MPTFKHPCPHCGQFIARDVVRCPFCGAMDPFVPGRCPTCRTPIDDPRWLACPKCGADLGIGAAAAAGAQTTVSTTRIAPDSVQSSAPVAPPAVPSTPAAAAGQVTPIGHGATPVTPPDPGAAIAAVKCTGCGSALSAGARFCTVCGTLAG